MFLFGTTIMRSAEWQERIMEQYNRFGPALRRRCERVLRNTKDAEDIVQELFMDIWKKKRDDLDFPYLYSAVTNRCITLLRTRQRHHRLLTSKYVTEPAAAELQDDSLFTQQWVRVIASRLDRTMAAIFVYRYIDEMTQEEIGEVMGLSRKTIGKKLAGLEQKLSHLSPNHPKMQGIEMGEPHDN